MTPPIVPGKPEMLADLLTDSIGCLRRLYRTHGPLVAFSKGPQHQVLFAFGVEYNQALLTDPELFYRTGFLPGGRGSAQRRLCTGLFNANGDAYKRQRRLLMPPFRKEVVDQFQARVAAVVEKTLAGWRPGQERDMAHEMKLFTLRITSEVMCGVDDLDSACRVSDTFEGWLEKNSFAYLQAALPLPPGGPTVDYPRMLDDAAALEAELLHLIEARRKLPPGPDVLWMLMQAQAAGGLSEAELAGQTAHLFNAAYHTTSYAMVWTLFLLAQHPQVMTAVCHELDAVLGSRPVAPADLPRLSLLERALKESMRLLPPVVYYPRTATRSMELAGRTWPTGTVVVASMYLTQHMPEIFPEPDRFVPDRWLTASVSPYAYHPFGGGPRMCIGGPFSYMVMKTALATILRRHRLTVVPGVRIDRKGTFTMGPRPGIPMLVAEPDRRFSTGEVFGAIREMVELPPPTARPAVAA